MRAAAVIPSRRQLGIIELPEPVITSPGEVLLRVLEVGVCGTDRELCSFVYGTPPPDSDALVLGHEALCEVLEAGLDDRGLCAGDLVVPAVRLPCSVKSCAACSAGHQDFCQTGLHRERGIKDLHGFMGEFVVEEARYLHRVPSSIRNVAVLTEPLTIAEKGYLQFRDVQKRLSFQRPKERVLVLGAGPVALLGAMKFRLEGHPVWVYSRRPAPDANASIAEAIGATYLSSSQMKPLEVREAMGAVDVIYEALGGAQLAFDVLPTLAPNGICLFTGIPRDVPVNDIDPRTLTSGLVLLNQVVLGIVNAGWHAFENAVQDLCAIEKRWPGVLSSLITHRYALEQFESAIVRQQGGIKSIVALHHS